AAETTVKEQDYAARHLGYHRRLYRSPHGDAGGAGAISPAPSLTNYYGYHTPGRRARHTAADSPLADAPQLHSCPAHCHDVLYTHCHCVIALAPSAWCTAGPTDPCAPRAPAAPHHIHHASGRGVPEFAGGAAVSGTAPYHAGRSATGRGAPTRFYAAPDA